MFNVGKSGKNLQSSPSSLQNSSHTNYSRQRYINIKPRFKSSVKFKKNACRFSDKKHPVDFAVVKELDEETNLHYYGARYLDPRTSRWIAGDPAIWQGDYIPVAPINDEARKHNQNLPGMGGIFNTVNMHAYHYAGNNPVKYVDPTGREIKVQFHRAFLVSPYLHASIRITLDTDELREAFGNHPLFQGNRMEDSNGNLFITIGGTRNRDGQLVGIINKTEDVNQRKEGSYLIRGSLANRFNEVASVRSILKAFELYEESGYLNYRLFPSNGEGYNSNSYISGILYNAGLQRDGFIMATGWGKPIPIAPRVEQHE